MMARRALPIAWLVVLIAGCASAPPPPDWQMNASASLARAMVAYLEGDQKLEALEFSRARRDVSATGRADLIARVELSRCAARVASLEFDDCPAFTPLAADVGPAERAFAGFLAGQAAVSDVTLLPQAYRGIAAGAVGAAALRRIEDPVSRLIAAGVLMRGGRAQPDVFELAIETASAQGWRRPLMVWLELQARRADAAGDATEAARLRRRIELVRTADGGAKTER